MSLIKVPCILVATVGLHRTFTAPNVSSKGEELPATGLWDWFLMATRRLMGVIKGVYWTIGVAEVATIWANNWPSAPISGQILSRLMVKGNASDLYLTPFSATGVVLITLGTLLRVRCFQMMKTFFTFDLSIHKNHKLVTTGPYGVVRHPSYSGMLMVYIGMTCWFGSRGSWLRESSVLETRGGRAFFGMFGTMMWTIMVGLLGRTSVEDGVLKGRFGEEWVEYAHNVPYSLIPWVY